MDIRKVKKLIELLEESGIAEIEIKEGEEAVRISRMPTGADDAQRMPQPLLRPRLPPLPRRPCSRGGRRRRRHARRKDDEHIVPAPMVGTYYAARLARRPSPSSRSAMKSRSARCCASSRP